MKIENFLAPPQSAFLSVEKDLGILTNLFFKNPRLKRLLYYTTSDALNRSNLNEEQEAELFKKNIKIIPKLEVDGEVLNYIIISFDNFTENGTNPEFRDNIISFDIICHFDQWKLDGDFQLRPYKIAAEIDSMLVNRRLTGIGKLEFLGANQLIINSEFAGISLMYMTIHGEEDKKGVPNKMDEDRFIKDFEETFNK